MTRSIFILAIAVFSCTQYFAQCPSGMAELIIEIVPDSYPSEISWDITSSGGIIASGASVGDTICIDTTQCNTFTIYDSYGDGICCGYGIGYYNLYIDGSLEATGGEYDNSESTSFFCPPGSSCENPILIAEGTHSAAVLPETWYEWSPDSAGIYEITTCLGATCDTRIWVYDLCSGLVFDSGNTGTIFYNDDNPTCGIQAYLTGIFDPAKTYYIRIGQVGTSCSSLPISWSLNYLSEVIGCMDPSACNYNPLATASDTCYYLGDSLCPDGPDLWLLEDVLRNSMFVDNLNNTDPCTINEGCLRGFGDREIIRFTTHIKNIGNSDYYIGTPSANPSQFVWDNCHSHNHYVGYAEYILYDEDNFSTPIGFKNGFCVMDLECDSGGAMTYGCGNMGISYDCGDYYGYYLDCQWIDITEVDTGRYVLVTRVNWDQSPDALGQYETSYENNWGQACFHLDRDPITGAPSITLDTACSPYLDCAGIPYGSTFVDCNGVCNGTALMGDINNDLTQSNADAIQYVDDILGNSISANNCNDLNDDGDISVYDASLINSCYLFGTNHAHDGGGSHDHCVLPLNVHNMYDTAYLSIIGYNISAGYIDIGIKNPSSKIVAYEFTMEGVTIGSVDNLQSPSQYPITPSYALGGTKVIGISYLDSVIDKSNTYQPLCRINIFNVTSSMICIESIVDVVDEYYHTVENEIEGPCIFVTGISENKEFATMQIQPNPSSNEATIQLNATLNLNGSLEVFDFLGKRVFRKTLNTTNETIEAVDVSSWNTGVYHVVFTSEGGTIQRPLQVVHE